MACPVLTLPMTHSPSAVALHHPLGASTGYMDARGDWAALVDDASAVSSFAVELAALDEAELPGLVAFLQARPALPFRYLSVHAPAKGRRLPEAELIGVLQGLRGHVDAFVVHPDTLEVPERWQALGACVVLENMDPRKRDGRTATELEPYFAALPGGRLLPRHRPRRRDRSRGGRPPAGRLRASDCATCTSPHWTPTATTSPSTPSDEAAWAGVLRRCRDVPWILEAPLPPLIDADPTGALETLAERSREGFPHLLAARGRTQVALTDLRERLEGVPRDPDVAVVLFGSWGRHEVTTGSDEDWSVLIDGPRRAEARPGPE